MFASSARGYHSLEGAKSDPVRRTRKDAVRKWREERPRSRRFSRPFSQGPMSFKCRLPPPRQVTNRLQDPALTALPLPLACFSSRQTVRPANRLSGQPIARRVESHPPTCPSPCGLPSQIVVPLLGEVANGASSTAPRMRLALPPRNGCQARPPGVDLDLCAHAQSRPLACTARFCLLCSWLRLRLGGSSSLPGRSCFSHFSPCAPTPDLPFSFYACVSPPVIFPVSFPSPTSSGCAPFRVSLPVRLGADFPNFGFLVLLGVSVRLSILLIFGPPSSTFLTSE